MSSSKQIYVFLVSMALLGCGEDSNNHESASAPKPISQTVSCEAVATDNFYNPPSILPSGRPGDVIRCEKIPTTLALLSQATRVMYRSTDPHGKPVATTGIVLEPLLPWSGKGERPLVGFTVGTHGQGDQCAPSRLLNVGVSLSLPLDIMVEYETPFIADLLSQGMAVVVTDYQGLGTPGVHTWLNRIAQGNADIDAVRAAQRLPGTNIPSDGPVAFGGYSQGGSSSAATAERLRSYGPELNVVGVYVGAAPRDIRDLVSYFDGTTTSGFFGYYLNGIASLYPEIEPFLDKALNVEGKMLRKQVANQCGVETIATYGLRPTSLYTADGSSIADLLDRAELRAIVAKDRLGTEMPAAPVLMVIGENDEIAPPAGVKQLAAEWCALGATVDLRVLPLPLIPLTGVGHISNTALAHLIHVRSWLVDRFNGVPALSTCP